jgi:Protein of unknown function (DUF1572)
MSQDLNTLVAEGFAARYAELAGNITRLSACLSEDQFWQNPFSFGNSFGHLVLHLTGNLNYYIGTEIAVSGYIRDRDREFTETQRVPKAEALKKFNDAVNMVVATLRAQTPADWEKTYTAKGEETAGNRFSIFLRCITHLHHHLGQMNYLCFELVGKKATGL